jgi:thiamine-monophosphate kinase
MDEFSLIAAALSHCADTTSFPTETGVGPGDDAAVIPVGEELLVISVDSYVEEIHFRQDWMSLQQIGARAIEGSISDIAAMGAEPQYVLIHLMCPKGKTDQHVVTRMYSGINQACSINALTLLGGDTTAGPVYSIGVTALGKIPRGQKAVRRSGMTPGNKICLSGPIGGAAAGLALCRAGIHKPKSCLQAFFEPKARNDIGAALGKVATAMIDLSDGLSSELYHLSTQSGCRVRLFQSDIPVAEGVSDAAVVLGTDPLEWILHGGEEYQLLFSILEDQPVPDGCVVIGKAVSGEGVVLVDAQGEEEPLIAGGYNHL